MATRAKTVTVIPWAGERATLITWTGLLNGDDGDPVEMPSWADRSIQFDDTGGAYGAGGTILLEGSNDGSVYQTLNDPQGNPISKTADAIEQVLEITRYMRPRVSAGDGTTNLKAYLLIVNK